MNRFLSCCTGLLLALTSSLALAADGRLLLPEHFELVTVNGQKIGGLLSGKQQVTLAEGQHIIEVQYFDLLEDDDGDSHSKVRSAIQAFNLLVEAGHSYRLQAERPDEVDAAYAYAAEPEFVIQDETVGKAIALKVISAEQRQTNLLQQMLGLQPQKPVAALQPASQPVEQQAAPRPAVAGAASAQPQPTTADADIEAQLLHWWQQATPAQRQRFLTKILSD